MRLAALFTLFTLSATASDFDHDGAEERIVVREARPHIETFDSKTKTWNDADFQLPNGITEIPIEAGPLRFIDLNGDGFGDLLFSDQTRFHIALWSTQVKPSLGWTKGWSQLVRSGARTGAGNEPPPLLGADILIADGDLIVRRRRENEKRIPLDRLLAFDIPSPKSPEEALGTFQLPDGFQIEIAAAEPEIVDPASFQWGADGRLWVVEMRDYPSGLDGKGKPGGVVKVLEDRDTDGRYETATVFLDDIPFPTGVMPWRNGVLISASPEIIFAEDTDGDGKADKKKVLFTGFSPGNQQHRVNGFEWGLDGWIHAANGDSGGLVKSEKTGTEINISGRDIRFRPGTGEIETVSSQSQFGRRRDDFGNWFGNNNPTWLWHIGLPEHYLRRNPKLAVKSPKRVLANYETPTRVFPASAPAQRPNQPWSLNHVTSACSPSPYRDDLFGVEFATSIFISEPVHNCVHREVLEPDGSGFKSHRAENEHASEFLASTDPWFRPTTSRTGPDGALYVADFYRFVIEHPEWISPETQARLELRAGSDKGRIYRISPKARTRRPIPDFSKMSTRQVADSLDSPNGWQRDTAQRLLLESDINVEQIAQLEALLTLLHRPQVRVQALATLGMLEELSPASLLSSLTDPHPGVRIEALRQSEPFARIGNEEIFAAVSALADDTDPRVRLQAAFSLGESPFEKSNPLLSKIAGRDADDDWIRAAVMSSVPPESELFASLNSSEKLEIPILELEVKPSTADRAKVMTQYGDVAKTKGDPERGHAHFQSYCAICHRFKGEGKEVGPDLEMVRGKPADWLLGAILDPAAAIEARYAARTVTTNKGETFVGIIAAETANSLTFRLPGGIDHPILRDDIKSLTAAGLTIMPAGFESVLDVQAMADLLAWLQSETSK
ncbi:MAG: putative membrane-bound dehydrogenase-like protein [Verrucomicrobiales bacterium]|jgi:putative membrane-bound dehydrogenase-like protein